MESLKLLQDEPCISKVVLSGLTSADIYCRACDFIFQDACDVDQGMHCFLKCILSAASDSLLLGYQCAYCDI